MRPTVLIAILLLLIGAGTLIFLNASGGTSSSGVSVEELLNPNFSESGRVRLPVQVVEFHHRFKPVEFDAIDIVPEGETPSADAPRIRVRYEGDDKIQLETYSHVSIEGRWEAQSKTFHATSMTTRCPSHYEEKGTPPAPLMQAEAP